MPTIGHIENYDPASGDFRFWAERLESYFDVNNVPVERRVSALISLLGSSTYALLRNLTAPASPSVKTYSELIALLSNHLAPKPILIAERFRFRKKIQEEHEPLASFVAELRRLSEHCAFENLEDNIRDQFVQGLRSTLIQNRLLTEDNLTLRKAIEIASSMDAAARDVGEFSNSPSRPTNPNLHFLTPKDKAKYYVKGAKPSLSHRPPDICRRCNIPGHRADDCRFRSAKCHNCGLVGHIQSACMKKGERKTPPASQPSMRSRRPNFRKPVKNLTSEDLDLDTLGIYGVSSTGRFPITAEILLNGSPITMEVDTGAAVSVISEDDFSHISTPRPLQATTLKLRTYTGELIKPKGVATVEVTYESQSAKLPLYIVERPGSPLLGRDWLQHIRLDWNRICHFSESSSQADYKLQAVLSKHQGLFDGRPGVISNMTAKLRIDTSHTPKFVKARPLPFALRQPVEKELEKKVREGILTPVESSDWGTPIVPILKKDASVRICGDYKITVNPILEDEHYPMPTAEELFATLAGCRFFSKLDMTQAFQQMDLEEASRVYLTLTTHKGLFRQNRLPFGIKTAPAIFQRTMEQILTGLPHTQNSQDDILVGGATMDDHLKNLDAVLTRLESYGVKLNHDKCRFLVQEVEYLGHVINRDGIQTTESKVRAIREAPTPKDVSQLRSFLGLVNYYHKFLPDLASILHPLHLLLHKDQSWKWTPAQDEAYGRVKDLIVRSRTLTHYDNNLPLLVASDASPYGLGAVLSHRFPDGTERVISFASRTLLPSERNYSQIDKEALAIIFAIKRFHQYIYGRHFSIVTDHKPLTAIFSPQKGLPTQSAARLQRWALFLSAHDYDIVYRPSESHANADAMSRVPLPCVGSEPEDDSVDIMYTNYFNTTAIKATDIAKESQRDPILRKVTYLLSTRWEYNEDKQLSKYFSRRHEISIHKGCLVWGMRVVVPNSLRVLVLKELHCAHPGIVRMKELARSYIWWPEVDDDIEKTAKQCTECCINQKNPVSTLLHPWAWPDHPWERVHADFAGPLEGKMFLILIDAHSKWPEVFIMSTTTASETIKRFQNAFSRYGLPHQVVSDNGPQFRSEEFGSFLSNNGIKRTLVAPYHPASNGQAERFVQSLKRALTKDKRELPLEDRLTRFLQTYRTTPHSSTQSAPATLFLKRVLRTRLDLMRPNISEKVVRDQQISIQRTPRPDPLVFNPGDRVWTRTFTGKEPWAPAIVSSQSGPVSYTVSDHLGNESRRHKDQLIAASPEGKTQPDPNHTDPGSSTSCLPTTPAPIVVPSRPTFSRSASETSPQSSQLRRTSRVSRPPDRLNL